MRSEPILILKNGETVSSMMYDSTSESVLLGTSEGRILLVKSLKLNAYMMGERTIYASVTGGAGTESNTGNKSILYGIAGMILEVTKDHEMTRWKSVEASGLDASGPSVGMFTTPVLWAGENFGWWGDLSWVQDVPIGCRVKIQVRIAGSTDDIVLAQWRTFEEDGSGTVAKSLDDTSIAGSYVQIRVYLESPAGMDSPSVSALVIPFFARHASYFFTTKMVMEKGSDIKGGLLVGKASVSNRTDIKWGVSGSASANWNDYVEVTPGKLFELPKGFGDRLKVGAKLVAYDDERYPTVDEFAVAFDSNIDNLIGRM